MLAGSVGALATVRVYPKPLPPSCVSFSKMVDNAQDGRRGLRSMGFGTSPRRGGIDPLRAELVQRLALARTREEVDALLEEAERWLCNRPYDEDVRAASEAATERRIRLFSDEQKREGG